MNKEYLESVKKAHIVNNFGVSIPGATETHDYKDGSSKTFVLQKDGNWKKTEETRVLTFNSESNKMKEGIIKVKVEIAGSIESKKEYEILLAELRLICAKHELDLFEF